MYCVIKKNFCIVYVSMVVQYKCVQRKTNNQNIINYKYYYTHHLCWKWNTTPLSKVSIVYKNIVPVYTKIYIILYYVILVYLFK